ncbi:MAG: MFS transporter [Pseudomonadota bacterium]
MSSRSKRWPLIFITMTLALDATGIGLILPVMPDLIRDVEGGSLGDAAVWGGILATAYAVMQFLFGPLLGRLSDSVGRRPVLLVSLGAMALTYAGMALAQTLWMLLAARLLGGMAAATQATAAASLSDLAKPGEKAQTFGLIGAAFGIGFVIGPLAGGLLSELGPRAPFIAAGLLALANLVLGALVLPETVTKSMRRPFDGRGCNPFAAFGPLPDMPGVGRLLLLFFLYEFAFVVYPATWAFFGQEAFGWSAATVGLSLTLFGVMMAIVQGGLIRWIIPRLGEAGTAIYGFCYNALIFAAMATVSDGRIALILTPMTALGAVVTPALQALMARRAGDDRQGELQGLISAMRAVAMILAPLAMTQVFFAFTDPANPLPYLPGAAFGLSLAIMLLCLAIFLPIARRTATA